MTERERLKQALEAAADDVGDQQDEPHKRMMASPAVPGWLTNILQLLGPTVLDAVRRWIDKTNPPTNQAGQASPKGGAKSP